MSNIVIRKFRRNKLINEQCINKQVLVDLFQDMPYGILAELRTYIVSDQQQLMRLKEPSHEPEQFTTWILNDGTIYLPHYYGNIAVEHENPIGKINNAWVFILPPKQNLS